MVRRRVTTGGAIASRAPPALAFVLQRVYIASGVRARPIQYTHGPQVVKWGKVHVVWKEGQTVEVYGEDDKDPAFWKCPDDVDTEEYQECADCDMD